MIWLEDILKVFALSFIKPNFWKMRLHLSAIILSWECTCKNIKQFAWKITKWQLALTSDLKISKSNQIIHALQLTAAINNFLWKEIK